MELFFTIFFFFKSHPFFYIYTYIFYIFCFCEYSLIQYIYRIHIIVFATHIINYVSTYICNNCVYVCIYSVSKKLMLLLQYIHTYTYMVTALAINISVQMGGLLVNICIHRIPRVFPHKTLFRGNEICTDFILLSLWWFSLFLVRFSSFFAHYLKHHSSSKESRPKKIHIAMALTPHSPIE